MHNEAIDEAQPTQGCWMSGVNIQILCNHFGMRCCTYEVRRPNNSIQPTTSWTEYTPPGLNPGLEETNYLAHQQGGAGVHFDLLKDLRLVEGPLLVLEPEQPPPPPPAAPAPPEQRSGSKKKRRREQNKKKKTPAKNRKKIECMEQISTR